MSDSLNKPSGQILGLNGKPLGENTLKLASPKFKIPEPTKKIILPPERKFQTYSDVDLENEIKKLSNVSFEALTRDSITQTEYMSSLNMSPAGVFSVPNDKLINKLVDKIKEKANISIPNLNQCIDFINGKHEIEIQSFDEHKDLEPLFNELNDFMENIIKPYKYDNQELLYYLNFIFKFIKVLSEDDFKQKEKELKIHVEAHLPEFTETLISFYQDITTKKSNDLSLEKIETLLLRDLDLIEKQQAVKIFNLLKDNHRLSSDLGHKLKLKFPELETNLSIEDFSKISFLDLKNNLERYQKQASNIFLDFEKYNLGKFGTELEVRFQGEAERGKEDELRYGLFNNVKYKNLFSLGLDADEVPEIRNKGIGFYANEQRFENYIDMVTKLYFSPDLRYTSNTHIHVDRPKVEFNETYDQLHGSIWDFYGTLKNGDRTYELKETPFVDIEKKGRDAHKDRLNVTNYFDQMIVVDQLKKINFEDIDYNEIKNNIGELSVKEALELAENPFEKVAQNLKAKILIYLAKKNNIEEIIPNVLRLSKNKTIPNFKNSFVQKFNTELVSQDELDEFYQQEFLIKKSPKEFQRFASAKKFNSDQNYIVENFIKNSPDKLRYLEKYLRQFSDLNDLKLLELLNDDNIHQEDKITLLNSLNPKSLSLEKSMEMIGVFSSEIGYLYANKYLVANGKTIIQPFNINQAEKVLLNNRDLDSKICSVILKQSLADHSYQDIDKYLTDKKIDSDIKEALITNMQKISIGKLETLLQTYPIKLNQDTGEFKKTDNSKIIESMFEHALAKKQNSEEVFQFILKHSYFPDDTLEVLLSHINTKDQIIEFLEESSISDRLKEELVQIKQETLTSDLRKKPFSILKNEKISPEVRSLIASYGDVSLDSLSKMLTLKGKDKRFVKMFSEQVYSRWTDLKVFFAKHPRLSSEIKKVLILNSYQMNLEDGIEIVKKYPDLTSDIFDGTVVKYFDFEDLEKVLASDLNSKSKKQIIEGSSFSPKNFMDLVKFLIFHPDESYEKVLEPILEKIYDYYDFADISIDLSKSENNLFQRLLKMPGLGYRVKSDLKEIYNIHKL
ncbi:MAG: hypothetical protein HRT47_11245 [Candidatus Caenarcaniphilales bacterium]|nr:hypothetical protein [Candidatus Caenarcaniphilales bacterium]